MRKGIEKSPAGGTPGHRQPRRRTASRRTARECGERQAAARGAGSGARQVASRLHQHGQNAATTARSGFRKQSRATSTAPVTRPPAASVREGMEDTQTVTALGVGDTGSKALAGTQALESANATIRTWTNRARRFIDGDMRRRWVAAALTDAASSWQRRRTPANRRPLRGRAPPGLVQATPAAVGERRAERDRGSGRRDPRRAYRPGRSIADQGARPQLKDPLEHLDARRARATLRAESYALVLADWAEQSEAEASSRAAQAGTLGGRERASALRTAKLKQKLAATLRRERASLEDELAGLRAPAPQRGSGMISGRLPLDRWIEAHAATAARRLALEQAVREAAAPEAERSADQRSSPASTTARPGRRGPAMSRANQFSACPTGSSPRQRTPSTAARLQPRLRRRRGTRPSRLAERLPGWLAARAAGRRLRLGRKWCARAGLRPGSKGRRSLRLSRCWMKGFAGGRGPTAGMRRECWQCARRAGGRPPARARWVRTASAGG